MEIGQFVQVIDLGILLEVIEVQKDGTRVFKQLPIGTKVDPKKVGVCFGSMLKPLGTING